MSGASCLTVEADRVATTPVARHFVAKILRVGAACVPCGAAVVTWLVSIENLWYLAIVWIVGRSNGWLNSFRGRDSRPELSQVFCEHACRQEEALPACFDHSFVYTLV